MKRKYKEVSIIMPDSKNIKFIVGNAILINNQITEVRVVEIKKGLFGKTVYIYLSDGDYLSYNNFPFILA